MSSRTDISNMALSHVGSSKDIADVDTENSAEAVACRRFLDLAIEEIFRDFSFPFSSYYSALALIETTPNTNWQYSYRYPSDCITFLKILSGVRNDSRQTRIPYEIASDASGKVIYTDEVDALCKYTKRFDDVSTFSTDIVLALSFLLAFYIAPRVTSGDQFKLGSRAYQAYVVQIRQAEANSLNELQDEEVVESEFIRSRE